jgi:hypothetical protein
MPSMMRPLPPQFSQGPSPLRPLPRQTGHTDSPAPGVPGAASSPGLLPGSRLFPPPPFAPVFPLIARLPMHWFCEGNRSGRAGVRQTYSRSEIGPLAQQQHDIQGLRPDPRLGQGRMNLAAVMGLVVEGREQDVIAARLRLAQPMILR